MLSLQRTPPVRVPTGCFLFSFPISVLTTYLQLWLFKYTILKYGSVGSGTGKDPCLKSRFPISLNNRKASRRTVIVASSLVGRNVAVKASFPFSLKINCQNIPQRVIKVAKSFLVVECLCMAGIKNFGLFVVLYSSLGAEWENRSTNPETCSNMFTLSTFPTFLFKPGKETIYLSPM